MLVGDAVLEIAAAFDVDETADDQRSETSQQAKPENGCAVVAIEMSPAHEEESAGHEDSANERECDHLRERNVEARLHGLDYRSLLIASGIK